MSTSRPDTRRARAWTSFDVATSKIRQLDDLRDKLGPLLPRRLILSAFEDARTVKNGQPTEIAREAYEWIMAETDWRLHHKPIPPPEIRDEFPSTFEFACALLGQNPSIVRQRGLPDIRGRTTGGIDVIEQTWGRVGRKMWDVRNRE